MSAVDVVAARSRPWSAVDRAMVQLVRPILTEDWDQAVASAHLREVVGDTRTLGRLAARVESALAVRSSELAERAAMTLRVAMGEAVGPA